MNRLNKLSWLFGLLLLLNVKSVSAQTKEDITGGTAEITWLGIDFSQLKYIGTASQFGEAGEITNQSLRDKYFPAWNNLFINEQKKYNVAKVVHRTEVKYALDVTEKTNSGLKGDFFTNSPDDYGKMDEAKLESLVKGYNFQGKTGIGLIFFADGMSKGKEEGSAWVAYVDMKGKKVLMSKHLTGKVGGIGLKNYWAKAFYNILKDSDYTDWK
ncbi:MAG: hypothetical protein QM737_09320 [Ferruginibacter sp.]